MRSPTENATLALLLEVTAAPTPGNVDRHREHPDLRFEQFLAGAVGAQPGLAAAASGAAVGDAFERAVSGMSASADENTQFGSLLLLLPLVRAAADGQLTAASARDVVETTTVADAAGFYRAFEHLEVRVDDPPEGLDELDVNRGADAIPALEERGMTLYDVLEASADRDGVAREWTSGFERTMTIADLLSAVDGEVPAEDDGPATTRAVSEWIVESDRLVERAARVHLWVLASTIDTLVVTAHGESTARTVRDRAQELLPDGHGRPPTIADRERFAEELIDDEINPGMTADLLAAGLFVALERDGVTL